MELLVSNSPIPKEDQALDLYRFFVSKREQFTKANMKVLKCQCKFKVESIHTVYQKTVVQFILLFTFFLENEEKMFHVEGRILCKAVFVQGIIQKLYRAEYQWEKERVMDLPRALSYENQMKLFNSAGQMREPNAERGGYDALKAVKYAERYWNEYNPNYPRFENDCTNYISQCLYAGGAEMVGGSNRTEGWWIRGNTWSYSWTTAHALYLFLINNRKGLHAKVVDTAEQLLLGDVICYDFEGDDRINHTTIVVGKTADGEPLVNAHTYNSRNRLWRYEDSSAYTSEIQYKFLQIYL